MRNRLIELLLSKSCRNKDCPDVQCDECPNIAVFESDAEKIADVILADGWIRPPCKKGDMIYVILHAPISKRYYVKETMAGNIHSINAHWYVEYHGTVSHLFEFGVKAFVNKEEAEQALSKLQASYEQVKGGAQE